MRYIYNLSPTLPSRGEQRGLGGFPHERLRGRVRDSAGGVYLLELAIRCIQIRERSSERFNKIKRGFLMKNSKQNYLKDEFEGLIDRLELSDLEKQFMKSRWLNQLLWLEGRAKSTKTWSTRFRMMTIIGGVLVPAFVSLNFNDNAFGRYIGWVTFGISQVVAISASMEEYFSFTEKQTVYRKTAESLKSEAWKFFQLTGSYKSFDDHQSAYAQFALRIERFIQEDIQAIMDLAEQNAKQELEEKQKVAERSSSGSKPKNGQQMPSISSSSMESASWRTPESSSQHNK